MNEQNRLNRAQEFARAAHNHIVATSITGVKKPQMHHIQEVADLVWISGGTEDEIIAAWLHDSVEDTDVTLDIIEGHFGKDVRNIVEGLTDHDHFKGLPIQERKKLQAERIKNENVSVRRIKMSDQISNVKHLGADRINTMRDDEVLPYILGAKTITDECRGISPILDNLFDTVYEIGVNRYKNA